VFTSSLSIYVSTTFDKDFLCFVLLNGFYPLGIVIHNFACKLFALELLTAERHFSVQ